MTLLANVGSCLGYQERRLATYQTALLCFPP